MRNLARAITAASVALAWALLGSAEGSAVSNASVHPAPGGAGSVRHAAGRLRDLLSSDSAAPLPGSGTHPLSIVTLYAVPTDTQWTTVADSAPTVADAIVNICDADGNGPGCDNSDWTSQNMAWNPTVSALEAAGITPLIYLTTDNGADSISALETELSQASQWWGITTPMFDQMAGTEGTANDGSGICTDGGADITCQSYYQQLYNYALSGGAQAVMFNPGTWYGMSPAFMYGPFEILQGFENSETTLEANSAPAPSWADSYGQFQFSATVSAASQPGLTTDVSDAMTDQHAGFIYEDDEAEPPNYGTLPSWFAAFLADLSSVHWPAQLQNPDGKCQLESGVVSPHRQWRRCRVHKCQWAVPG